LLPIVLNETAVSVGLAGTGDAFARRRAMLEESGVTPALIASNAKRLDDLTILFVAGLSVAASARLANLARARGVLVNVEDVPALCDFHVPAAIRRGDLVLTVSTGGKSPGLAKLIHEWLEQRLGLEWSERLKEISQARASWRATGQPPSAVAQRTRDFVREREWLR
jgi:precorrin-2 dehydrogenase/sirohydrochlorin ferrochelatase